MEIKKREHWGNEIDFILSCIGYAVGLGNIWRFPYLCMRNGGGAFLIPYFFFMFISAVPLFFLEMGLGQFSGKSSIAVFDFCPLFRGLGWGMVILSLLCTAYFNTLITWILYYLGMTFTSWEPLWGKCDNVWNTPNCTEPGITINSISPNTTIQLNDVNNATTYIANVSNVKLVSSVEEFWHYNVLDLSDGIEKLGGLKWKLVICHFAAWLIVFLCIMKGVRLSGKVVYVTATVPYIFLTALLIRGVTLPGSLNGILYYIRPDFKKLLSFNIWSEACMQIFFSLGPSWGGLITMASYNKFDRNIQRDAMLLPLAACCTSFFAGFIVFSIVGFMAFEANVPIEDTITSGPGLAFIAYPAALTKVPGAAIWSALFFIMLLTLGLDTVFVMVEVCISAIIDQYPRHLRKRKVLVSLAFSIFSFMIGLIFVSRAGMYWFQLLDWYIAMFTLILIGIIEPIIVSYIYGMERFYSDMEMMFGFRPYAFWKGLWYFVTPVTLSVFLVYLLINQVAPTYGSYRYPEWAIGLGWVVAVCPILPTFGYIIKHVAFGKGNLLQRLKLASRPNRKWLPLNANAENETKELEMIVQLKS